tara:strand:+ start:82 stop:282 length:201 start_codon:yes stop_codon:yes gene_type:complete
MKKWEYLELEMLETESNDGDYATDSGTSSQVNKDLNKLGLLGWELVSMYTLGDENYPYAVFKRIIV